MYFRGKLICIVPQMSRTRWREILSSMDSSDNEWSPIIPMHDPMSPPNYREILKAIVTFRYLDA